MSKEEKTDRSLIDQSKIDWKEYEEENRMRFESLMNKPRVTDISNETKEKSLRRQRSDERWDRGFEKRARSMNRQYEREKRSKERIDRIIEKVPEKTRFRLGNLLLYVFMGFLGLSFLNLIGC